MNQKIALVEPRIPAGESLGIEKSPMSIQMLAGQFSGSSDQVRMFHETVGEALYQKLAEFSPQILGISTMTANFPEGKKVAEAIKKIRSDIKIIIGGWHASGCAQAHLKGQESESIKELIGPQSPFDFVIVGEGDVVFPELVRRLETGKSVADLKGVNYLDPQEIRISVAERIEDLDALSDPSWEGLPIDDYRDKRTGSLDLSIHSKRACRFDCGFCSTETVYGRRVKKLSPRRTLMQIEAIAKKFKPEVITFTDEDFFADINWIAEVVRLFEEENISEKFGISFDTFISVIDLYRMENNQSHGAIFERMKKAGFGSFTIGVESFNSEILRKYNKKPMILPTMSEEQKLQYEESTIAEQDRMLSEHYFEITQKAIDYAQRQGFIIVGDYIIGNLGESEARVIEGFEKFSSLRNLHVIYLPIFTPFPGTKLWKESYDSGKIIRTPQGNIDWSRFDGSAGALDLGYDVNDLRNKLEVQFYTSERYHTDMRGAIERNPDMLGMFRSRFEYLNRRFPGNKLVEERLQELG
jgi:anaerobic magnesium-protoporphyrin IX monomethyl ester cyclase